MTQFIAYHVDDSYADGVPVAAGTDQDAVRRSAITRILGVGLANGQIVVQERIIDVLEPADWASLVEALDSYFAEKLPGEHGGKPTGAAS